MAYSRIFMALTCETSGYDYKGKRPSGRCILEIKNHEAKLSCWIQDLKTETMYTIWLLFPDQARYAGLHLGSVSVDAKGKAETRHNFEAATVLGGRFALADCAAVVIMSAKATQPNSILCGYRDEPFSWKKMFYDASKVKTEEEIPEEALPLSKLTPEEITALIPPEEAELIAEYTRETSAAMASDTICIAEAAPAEESIYKVENIITEEPAVIAESVITEKPAVIAESVITEKPAVMAESIIAEEPAVMAESIIAEEPAIIAESIIPEEPAVMAESIIAEEPAVMAESIIAEEPIVMPEIHHAEESIYRAENIIAEEPAVMAVMHPTEDAAVAEDAYTCKAPIIHEPNDIVQRFRMSLESIGQEPEPIAIDKVEAVHRLFNERELVTPFSKQNKDAKWIKIKPDDADSLPEKAGKLLKEAFIKSAHERFKHLLLGIIDDAHRPQCIIGVPDMFNPESRMQARKLGFLQFKCSDEPQKELGEFGYWLMFVDF